MLSMSCEVNVVVLTKHLPNPQFLSKLRHSYAGAAMTEYSSVANLNEQDLYNKV